MGRYSELALTAAGGGDGRLVPVVRCEFRAQLEGAASTPQIPEEEQTEP
jgi:hypothetical protein